VDDKVKKEGDGVGSIRGMGGDQSRSLQKEKGGSNSKWWREK